MLLCDLGIHPGDLVWVIHSPSEAAEAPSSDSALEASGASGRLKSSAKREAVDRKSSDEVQPNLS